MLNCGVALKNGSYWRTGLPLLLYTFSPVPTQRGLATGEFERTGLRLNPGLRFPPEAVGIDETELDFALSSRHEIAHMGLARDRGGADRDSREIVDDAARRRAEMGDGERARVGGGKEGS